MTQLQRKIWFLVAVLFAVLVTILTLSHMVANPSHIIPELGRDGAKNNFTYLYQCMYGKGYWFDGMNYPYGEHIVYTDGQPVLSVLFTCFKNVSAGDALTVLWLLIGFSYVLSILYVYKILVHFKTGPLAALLFAGLTCIFTPQILRLQGHYALSYTCIIPMLFYWTIQYHELHRLRYCMYVFIAGCIMAFIHPYYAAMMLIWVGCYAIAYFIFTKATLISKLKFISPIAASVIGIMAVVAIVMKLTDPITDRPVSPLNTFYETCTRPKQIITSTYSPVWQFVKERLSFKAISDGGEGYMYLGIAVIFILMISVCSGIINSIKKKRVIINAGDSGFSPVWIFAAFFALLFSMGVPFIWHIQWLNYLSVFKQFRSLGRFSWIAYYVIAIYAVIVVYQYSLRLIKNKKLFAGYGVLVLSIGIWSYEASGYIAYSRKLSDCAVYNYNMIFSTYEQSWPSWLQERRLNKNDFQAILLLPFFHVGTEKLWLGDPGWLLTMGSKAALQLHLPIIDVNMSRSSWSQAQKQVKIAGGEYVDMPILHDIKSTKPFLLMKFQDDTLNPDQKYLLTASDYIGHFSQCDIYACYPERLAEHYKRNVAYINTITPFMKQEDTCIGGKGSPWYVNHFDSRQTALHLFGAGSAGVIAHDDSLVAEFPVRPHGDSELYEFSCWFLLGNKDFRSAYINLEMINSAGKHDTSTNALTRESADSYGMWFRASKYFYIHNNISMVRCNLVNTPNPAYLAMDEMLLRPADALIISKAADGSVLVNNHLFKTEK